MANFKVAVFIALVVVLSQTAYSNADCDNDCLNVATLCTYGCSDQVCARGCTRKLNACFDKCGLKAGREFQRPRPLPREAYQNDPRGDEDFYEGFQK